MAGETIWLRDYQSNSVLVDLTFNKCRGEGRLYPKLILDFQARAHRGLKVIPKFLFVEARLRIRGVNQEDSVIGTGSAPLPLNEWTDSTNRSFSCEVPLTQQATKAIQDNLRDDYLNLSLGITGLGSWVREQGGPLEVQFGKAIFEDISLSKIDWLKQVLEPIGAERYFFITIPVPKLPDEKAFSIALQHLGKANEDSLWASRREFSLGATMPGTLLSILSETTS